MAYLYKRAVLMSAPSSVSGQPIERLSFYLVRTSAPVSWAQSGRANVHSEASYKLGKPQTEALSQPPQKYQKDFHSLLSLPVTITHEPNQLLSFEVTSLNTSPPLPSFSCLHCTYLSDIFPCHLERIFLCLIFETAYCELLSHFHVPRTFQVSRYNGAL